jgi:hypothetical protein
MTITIEPGVTACRLDDNGGLDLVAERQGTLLHANHSGASMWTALVDCHGRVDDAAARVANEYEIDVGRARADLLTFIEALAGAGLVRGQQP